MATLAPSAPPTGSTADSSPILTAMLLVEEERR
uniref:Uncharacterized protein n=1 Tax=Arundo donax TaxID=35708 RepID=A0A0A8ZN47_ARUDO